MISVWVCILQALHLIISYESAYNYDVKPNVLAVDPSGRCRQDYELCESTHK